MLDHTLSGDLLYLAKGGQKNHRNCPGAMVLCTTTEPKATTESEPIHCEQRAFSGFLKSLILPGKNRTAFSTVIGISFPKWNTWHFARNASKCLFKHTLCQCIHLCFAQMAPKKTNEKSTFSKHSHKLNIENVFRKHRGKTHRLSDFFQHHLIIWIAWCPNIMTSREENELLGCFQGSFNFMALCPGQG